MCCIYHKPRPVGESSSESESDSSSSDSDSDSETDHQPRSGSRHSHPHNAGSTRDDDQTLERGRATCCAKHHSKEGKRRKPSPNAYEKMPTPGKSHTKSQGSWPLWINLELVLEPDKTILRQIRTESWDNMERIQNHKPIISGARPSTVGKPATLLLTA